ncbi:MAG: putative toxin-antitoxin system toxin component, PIN family [Chloroflexi bacterium]|nr:putative toxin-antitoxin system toxin component, PIN family [Chloroflexota bacterium]
MISAVLDTNVLASGILGLDDPESPPGQLLQAWERRAFQLVLSRHILAELERTLASPYFARRLRMEQIIRAFALVRNESVLTQMGPIPRVASHPEDDLILAAAVSARVDYLVTGDKQLQLLGSYEGVAILSPREFLDLLLHEQPAHQSS